MVNVRDVLSLIAYRETGIRFILPMLHLTLNPECSTVSTAKAQRRMADRIDKYIAVVSQDGIYGEHWTGFCRLLREEIFPAVGTEKTEVETAG